MRWGQFDQFAPGPQQQEKGNGETVETEEERKHHAQQAQFHDPSHCPAALLDCPDNHIALLVGLVGYF